MEMTLAYQDHPFLAGPPRLISDPFMPGETLGEYFRRHALPTVGVAVTLNDIMLRPANLELIAPKHGDFVAVRAMVEGGGSRGGSNPMAMAAMIAVTLAAGVVTAGVGSMLMGGAFIGEGMIAATGWAAFGGAMAGAVFATGGMLLVSALLPPAKIKTSESSTSSNYQISGASNRLRPYEPMPLLIGSMRMAPDLAAKVRTRYRKDSTGDHVQQAIIGYQFGPVRMTLSWPKIGDTALDKFKDYELHQVDTATWRLPDSVDPRNVDTISVGELKKTSGWIERQTSEGTTAIELEFTGIYYWAYNNGGYGPEKVQLQIEYALAGTSDWKPMYAAKNGAWRTTVSVYRLTYRYSGDTPEPIETLVSQTSTLSNWGNSTALTAGETETRRDDDDETTTTITRTVVAWDPDATPDSGASTVTIGGSRGTDPVTHTFWRSVQSGQYRVRVRKLTEDPTSSRLVQTVAWSQLRSWQRDTRTYPAQRRVGLCIKASELANGSLDVFTMWAVGRSIGWNGSKWAELANTNPAWWFLEIALGMRGKWVNGTWIQRRGGSASDGALLYGAGLRWNQIDLDVIKSWGQWCDANNWKIHAVHDENISAGELLSRIASIGRASIDWSTGKLGVVWDEPNQPYSAVFGMANIKKGSFSVEYLQNTIIDEVVASYKDKDTGEDKTIRVLRSGVTVPEKTITASLWGTGSEQQAVRICNLMIAEQVYRRRVMTWEADFEHLVVRRGSVVLLSHDLTQWGYSGRIVTGSIGDTVTLTLDRAVTVERGRVYHVAMRAPSGEFVTGTTIPATVSGDTDELVCSVPDLETVPDRNWIWFFDALPTPGKLVKVISVVPNMDGGATIMAVDEDEAYYLSEHRPGLAADTSTSRVYPKLDNIRIGETAINATTYRVTVFWTLRDAIGASLKWRTKSATDTEWGEWEAQKVIGTSKNLTMAKGHRLQVFATPVPLAGLVGETYASTGAGYVA